MAFISLLFTLLPFSPGVVAILASSLFTCDEDLRTALC